ncbi:MAG: hypothetical protein H0X27_09255 [Caulobacteraceae bacterium]|nr:hypothetical protein [Caulobacteraceae bacterium]
MALSVRGLGDDLSNPLCRVFAPMIGLPAWRVHHGFGSFLTLEFGQPHLKIYEPIVASAKACDRVRQQLARRRITPTGEWHLWIYCCHWRMLSDGAEIAWSEASDDTIGRAASDLDGRLLTGLEVDPPRGTSVFHFEGGRSLRTWPYDGGLEEQWMLHMKSGDIFEYRGDGFYSLGPGDRSMDEAVWHPLRPDAPG